MTLITIAAFSGAAAFCVFVVALMRIASVCDEVQEEMREQVCGPRVIEVVRAQETPAAQFARRMERCADSQNSTPRIDQIDRDFYLVYGGE